MQRHDGQGIQIRKLTLQGIAFGRRSGEGLPDLGERAAAICDRRNQARDSRFTFGQLGADRGFASRDLAGAAGIVVVIFADEGRHHVGIEQLLGQAIDGAPLEVDVVDRPTIRADGRPALAEAAASPTGLANDRIGIAALSADAKLRQQLRRASRLFARPIGEFGELLLYRLPQIIVDDLKVRHRVERPFFARPRADAGFPGARVNQLLRSAYDKLAIVEPVAQDSVLPRPASGERIDLPELAARRSDAVPVQILGDLARRSARGIFGEDPLDDGRSVGVDFAQPVDCSSAFVELKHLAIAVGDAGGG